MDADKAVRRLAERIANGSSFAVDAARIERELQPVRELVTVLTNAHSILKDAPELNPVNFTSDQAVDLNAAANEAYLLLNAALAKLDAEGER